MVNKLMYTNGKAWCGNLVVEMLHPPSLVATLTLTPTKLRVLGVVRIRFLVVYVIVPIPLSSKRGRVHHHRRHGSKHCRRSWHFLAPCLVVNHTVTIAGVRCYPMWKPSVHLAQTMPGVHVPHFPGGYLHTQRAPGRW